MPRLRVIMLDQEANDPDNYRVVLWADVPAPRQPRYANANTTSAWINATASDNAALANGSVVEQVVTQRVAKGTTFPQVQSLLQAQWQNFQSYINSYNPWQRYGTTWDGTTWTAVNNG